MLQTEYVRNLHCNYERLLLEEKPEDTRYQYCILSRGGIKGLLPCSMRYINGLTYLYYDISSKQNIVQLFENKAITREWMQDFLWSSRQIQQELDRFLLDDSNVVWNPEQIFLDLDNRTFFFMYIPYHKQENGFEKLVDFWVEHIDYEDEALVEFVYCVYDQLEKKGDTYLQKQIFEDAKRLEKCMGEKVLTGEMPQTDVPGKSGSEKGGSGKSGSEKGGSGKSGSGKSGSEKGASGKSAPERALSGKGMWETSEVLETEGIMTVDQEIHPEIHRWDEKRGTPVPVKEEKKKLFGIFEGKKKKNREARERFRQEMEEAMNGCAVAEEEIYECEGSANEIRETDYGRTVYMEERPGSAEVIHRLYSPEGRLLASLDKETLSMGKKKEEVDLVFDDMSVSRMHARIIKQGGEIYLEDLNSTNGTFKNGLRLEPYERRKLETGDEIKCGNVTVIFR